LAFIPFTLCYSLFNCNNKIRVDFAFNDRKAGSRKQKAALKMFQYWFKESMRSAELIDRMHEIADTCSKKQIEDRIEEIKQRATKAALAVNETKTTSTKQTSASYVDVVKEDLERSTFELMLLGKILDNDF